MRRRALSSWPGPLSNLPMTRFEMLRRVLQLATVAPHT